MSPTQIRWLLQTTARPVQAVDDDGEPTGRNAPFWQVGYGRVDLREAVAHLRNTSRRNGLEAAQAALDARILASMSHRVLRSDLATWDAPRATLGTDVREFEVPRAPTATHLKVTIVFPSEATLGADIGLTQYSVRVVDAAGRVLVETTERAGIGSAGALVPIPSGAVGPYTATVTGDRAVSDPDTLDSDALLNDTVTLQLAQMRAR